tara:strand:+ start:14685 stop:15158 length:474 start_codon:yes stop_codon:yes gene_type:complete
MDLDKIKDFIRFISKSGVTDISLETEDFKISISSPAKRKKGQQTTTIQEKNAVIQEIENIPTQNVIIKEEKTELPTEEESFKSPMIGTFYRKSNPDKDPFVQVGDEVKEGDVLCVIEAMKLFNEIEANFSGKILKILVDDQQPVEYDQPLFLIETKK